MAKSTMPLIGLLAVGGFSYYRFTSGEATTTSATTTSPTTTSPTTTSPTTTSSTTTSTITITEDEVVVKKNYVDEWIDPPIYNSNSDFRKFMEGEVDELHNPFSLHKLMGWTEWKSDSKVELKDSDGFKTSGGIDLQIAQGYKVKLKITTNNWNYFKNGVYVNGDTGRSSAKDYVKNDLDGTAGDELIEVWFYPNDRLEVDIDGEHSGAYTFGMKMKGGTEWIRSKGGVVDDEVYVQMRDIKIRNPDYDPNRFATEFNAPFGGFRLFKGLFAAFKGARIWKVFGLGGKATGAVGASRIAGTIPEGTTAVGVISKGASANKISRIEGVSEVREGGKVIKLKSGYKAVDEAGNVIADGRTLLRLENADDVVKIVRSGSSVGGGANTATGGANLYNRIFTGRNVITTTIVAVGGSVALGAYRIFGEILPDGVEKTLKNLTTPCPDQCEGSEDYDTCLEECNKAKQETQAKIGLVVVASILGLALILKKPSDSKGAEGYYVLRT